MGQRLGQINGIVTPKENSNNKLLYIQWIIYYTNLSYIMKSQERLNKSKTGTVWLTEDRELIKINEVIDHVEI